VKAEDEGIPSRNSNATVIIQFIENEETAPPVWIGDTADFTVTVPENINPTSILLNFSAESKRSVAGLSFGLVDSLSNLFSANILGVTVGKITTGSLTSSRLLDYETAPKDNSGKPVYSLTLQATVGSSCYSLIHNTE